MGLSLELFRDIIDVYDLVSMVLRGLDRIFYKPLIEEHLKHSASSMEHRFRARGSMMVGEADLGSMSVTSDRFNGRHHLKNGPTIMTPEERMPCYPYPPHNQKGRYELKQEPGISSSLTYKRELMERVHHLVHDGPQRHGLDTHAYYNMVMPYGQFETSQRFNDDVYRRHGAIDGRHVDQKPLTILDEPGTSGRRYGDMKPMYPSIITRREELYTTLNRSPIPRDDNGRMTQDTSGSPPASGRGAESRDRILSEHRRETEERFYKEVNHYFNVFYYCLF